MRGSGLVAVVALLLGGVVAVGVTQQGHPAQDVRMGSGAVWLASSRVGQITLLDGSSGEVAAQVQVAPAGDVLEVAQQGADAYAVDQTAGTVHRVDGATLEPTEPESPIPGADAGLIALPGPDVLYAVDVRSGILANVDPGTLARRGELMSLASELSAGTATVDDAGTLWGLDNTNGDLVRVADGKRTVRRQVAKAGRGVLAVSNRHPVLVDLADRKAISIDPETGRVAGAIELDLRADDTVQVSGSPRAERLYLVLGRGVVVICDLPSDCDTAVPLNAGSTYGAAVEAHGRLFVPDYTTGQVLIIDLAQSRVIARPTVLTPPAAFQLITRDGVVFYNDTDTERAGVVRLDGTVVPVRKYDPADPDKGVPAADTDGGDLPQDADDPRTRSTDPPGDGNEPPRDPDDPPGDRGDPPQGQDDPGDPPRDSEDPPGDQDDPPPDPGDPPGDPPGDDPPEPALRIVMNDTSPTVGDVVTLRVDNTAGDDPVSANWTFGDGEQGTGVTTSHQWTAPNDSYLITVVATLPDGREDTTSVNIAVAEVPTVTLTVSIPDGGGTVSGDGGISCPPTCQTAVPPDTQLTLTAQPGATHLVGTWGGACTGQSGNTCDVTMNADQTVSHRFDLRPQTRTLTVVLDAPDPVNGMVDIRSGGTAVLCPPTCTRSVNQGEVIELRHNRFQRFVFSGWRTGPCARDAVVCSVQLNNNQSVTAEFVRLSFPPGILELDCQQSGPTSFRCTITHNAGLNAPTQVRWVVNGQPSADVDNNDSLGAGCNFGNNSVSVTIRNSDGEDTRSGSVFCRAGLPPPR